MRHASSIRVEATASSSGAATSSSRATRDSCGRSSTTCSGTCASTLRPAPLPMSPRLAAATTSTSWWKTTARASAPSCATGSSIVSSDPRAVVRAGPAAAGSGSRSCARSSAATGGRSRCGRGGRRASCSSSGFPLPSSRRTPSLRSGSAEPRLVASELVIEARNLTKRYGDKTAVSDLSFTVKPGIVTGFLGPNGSGKSTTMRLILGLDAPNSGDVTVNGKHYADYPAPLHEVGALLEARSVHTGRSAYNHLLTLAQTHGIPRPRVDELIELVGLESVARKRAGQFSLGMGQRLGIAAALLGDPDVVILDEPVNGLDPDGIRWVRDLLKALANDGRTVFLSSHLMSEMSLTADHLIVIG